MPNVCPTHWPSTAWITAFALTNLMLLSGCQEDARASQTSIARSAELTDERLKQATGNLLQALGQPDLANLPVPEGLTIPELSWSPPLTREDGSALPAEQIAGFHIYFRLRHHSSDQVIIIDDPSVTKFSLKELPPGAYRFAITALDVHGQESRLSTPVIADIL